MEVARGWTVNPDGTDTATAAGRWARGNPAATTLGGVTIQPTTTTSGSAALVTGLAAGSTVDANDLDGRTTVRSTPISLSTAEGQSLSFRWFFAHGSNATADDHLEAIVEDQSGSQTVVWAARGTPATVGGTWTSALLPLETWAGQTIHLRFEAADAGGASTIEAGIDDVRVTRPTLVPRLAGPDRFDTAAAISANTFEPGCRRRLYRERVQLPRCPRGCRRRRHDRRARCSWSPPRAPSTPPPRPSSPGSSPPRSSCSAGPRSCPTRWSTALSRYTTAGTVERYCGHHRFATAAAISAHTFEPGCRRRLYRERVQLPRCPRGCRRRRHGAGPGAPGRAHGSINAADRDRAHQAPAPEDHRARRDRVVSDAVPDGAQRHTTGGNVERYAGATRFATAAAISAHTFSPGCPVAYVANAYNFPDALAGAAAAGTVQGPVLLVAPTGTINASTATELTRLEPQKIIVLGGTAVVSEAVPRAQVPSPASIRRGRHEPGPRGRDVSPDRRASARTGRRRGSGREGAAGGGACPRTSRRRARRPGGWARSRPT